MHLSMTLVTLALFAGTAHADAPKPALVFPVVDGTKFTFAERGTKENWTTTLTAGPLAQYVPHEDEMNYFTRAGMIVERDGIYIVGEVIADTGEKPPMPAKAIAFPIKKGAVGKVPGFLPSTYTVAARETVKVPAGKYTAWKIALADKVNPTGYVWIAPGVGIVKIQLPSGRVDELVKIEPPK